MSPITARSLVFATSAAVLVLEILAGRLLAPYVGVSLATFTGIIGTILAGIATGSWLGGRAADRATPAALLGPLLVGGGLTALAAPLIVDALGPTLAIADPVAIVTLTLMAFFLPAAMLSAVSPVVVKIRLDSLAETGRVVGAYSAFGTAGAIFGTFLTGFVLVAAWPSRPIVLAVGTALVVVGVAFTARRPGGGGALAMAGTVALGAMLVLTSGPCQYETAYHCAVVTTDPERPTGRVLYLDGVPNSYVDLADPGHLDFRYARAMADVISEVAPGGELNVVSVGGGGFTMPAYLRAVRPGTVNTILEIDAALVEVGVEHLGFDPEEATVVIDDARRSLVRVPPGSVDVVIGDAFSGLSVPWHLTTTEFVSQVASRLRPDGLYVLNVIDYGDLDLARAEAATLRQVFNSTVVVAPPAYLEGAGGGNFVLAASGTPIDAGAITSAISSRGGTEEAIGGLELDSFIGDARPLTDDFAPVDQMIDRP